MVVRFIDKETDKIIKVDGVVRVRIDLPLGNKTKAYLLSIHLDGDELNDPQDFRERFPFKDFILWGID